MHGSKIQGGTGYIPDRDPDSFTWTSSNPSVAKVDSEGNVTAVAEGKTVITVSGAGLSGSVNVAVKGKLVVAAKTIRLNRKTLSLSEGKKSSSESDYNTGKSQ